MCIAAFRAVNTRFSFYAWVFLHKNLPNKNPTTTPIPIKKATVSSMFLYSSFVFGKILIWNTLITCKSIASHPCTLC